MKRVRICDCCKNKDACDWWNWCLQMDDILGRERPVLRIKWCDGKVSKCAMKIYEENIER